MRQHLVYDLPTRFFHWLFASLFLVGFVIAKTVDDDSILFSYHSLAGLTLGFLVLLRIIWGLFGTKHARFSGFALQPLELVSYLKGILTNNKKRWAGHNPASSWAGIIMMTLGLGLSVTGYLMTSGTNKELFEDVHQLFANGFIIIVIMHISGIIFHTIRHQEMIAFSMIDGKKADITSDQTISSSKSIFGIFLLILVETFGIFLFKNFDSQSRSLYFFGKTLQLGESEQGEFMLKNSVDQREEAKEERKEKNEED